MEKILKRILYWEENFVYDEIKESSCESLLNK